MNNLLFSYLFLCTPIYIYSQELSISGKVIITHVSDSIDFNSISVFNVTTQAKSKVNRLGLFTIEVQLNDELVFTSDFTEKRVIKVTESIIKKGFITVYLDLEVIELAEANLTPLKARLRDNIRVDKTEVEKLQDEVNHVTPEFRQKMLLEHEDAAARRTISEVGGINLLGLGTAIFGIKNKSKPRIKSNFEVAEEIKKYFTTTYFIDDLNIPAHKVNEFLGYCLQKTNIKKLFEKRKIEEVILSFEAEGKDYLNLVNR